MIANTITYSAIIVCLAATFAAIQEEQAHNKE